ncbi:DUF4304 domain-containing protein [Myxococcota bacterium]|nr:DUF4304 domain-containing protein [Myxococcota bacterium]
MIRAFRTLVEPELAKLGFSGEEGHLVRRIDGLTHVIELQHSIYGGRVTANLGLDLECLKPLVRWIDPPALGPHAHDATRWVRIGMVRPERADQWWSFSPDSSDETTRAAKACGRAILDHGVPWLDAEATPDAFLGWATARVERSKTPARPDGSFLDLRLMAAILAWQGRLDEARSWIDRARGAWPEERARLVDARRTYADKHRDGQALADVPDLVAELEALIEPTTASSAPADGPSRGRPRRSRSARTRSSRA